jgi:hypothetical protein
VVGPDANYVFAGFVREADGTLTTFDVQEQVLAPNRAPVP